MSLSADAWVLYRGEGAESRSRGKLVRETFELLPPGADEVLATPLFGCWEGNMGHALERMPIDVCRDRKEAKVVLGNAGVVRVEEVGENVRSVRPGQHAIIFCNGKEDYRGYPEKIFGYDAPGTHGCLAKLMKLGARQVIPIPDDNPYSLAQWAAFSLRYITAWSNWELAFGTFRLQVTADELASPHVWGWGGGTTLAELDLARRFGCSAVMLSGNDRRLETIRATGLTPLDRRQFGNLTFDEERFEKDSEYQESYRTAETSFLQTVERMTRGRMVQIFVDLVGAPVWRATLRATSREAVVTTAGWKQGMHLSVLRAVECISRRQHIHTHYARYSQGWSAVAFGAANGWMPRVDERIYSFDDIPELADDYLAGRTGMFPCFSVAT